MTQTIKVSKSTKNALTSTTPNDFYLDAQYALLKIHASGAFTTNTGGTKTITHNLGYRPFVLVFSQYADDDGFGGVVITDEYYQHDWRQEGATITFFGQTKIYANTIDIEIGNTNAANPGFIDGFYYIFKEAV